MEDTRQSFLSVLEEALQLLDGSVFAGEYSADTIIVVGDTHGFRDATLKAFKLADQEHADLIVFLGDYVDRGPEGVENLYEILSAIVEGRHKIIMLRGNHEDDEMNYYYGFHGEAIDKIGREGYHRVVELFNKLPIYAIVNNWLMVHGGVPCRDCSGVPEEPLTLSSIRERRLGNTIEDPTLYQMVWNDPRGYIEWFEPNMRGPGTYYYGREAWKAFLKQNSLKGIIRGHEVSDALQYWAPNGRHETLFPNGWEKALKELEGGVITVFSSKYHGGRAGIVLLNRETIRLYII